MPFDSALSGLLFFLVLLFVTLEISGRLEMRALLRLLERVHGHPSGETRTKPKRFLKWRASTKPEVDLAALCIEVVSRLRAGSPVSAAWKQTWSRATGKTEVVLGAHGIPEELLNLNSEALSMVVGATRFSVESGAPLADVLASAADSLNQLEEGVKAQQIAFAGPRLSARVLTALPVVGLLGGELLGAAPFEWFLSGPMPFAVLLFGLGFAVAGHLMSQRLIATAARGQREALRAPILCDLAGAGLRGGGSVPAVLAAMGQALQEPSFERVSAELLLGARWEEAWEPLPPSGGLLATALQPAWEDGVAPKPLLHQSAMDARRRAVTSSKEAAERLAVKLALPLGLLLLPAFILLGLIPILFVLIGGQGGFGLSVGF